MKKIISLIMLGLLFSSLTKAQATEQQIWLNSMIVAYETNPIEAREIAIKYLNERLEELSFFEAYSLNDKDGAVHRAVTLIQHILIFENKIEPAKRFGHNHDFMELIEQVLVKTKEKFAQLNKFPEYSEGLNNKKYIKRTLEYCIRGWISIRKNIIPRDYLEKSYKIFQEDLKIQGFTSLNEVLAQDATIQANPQYKEQPLQLTIKSDKEYPKITEQTCDAMNLCPEGLECFNFIEIGLRCAQPNPCSYYKCPDNTQCIIAESSPPQVICGCIAPK